jgi:Trypsin-like peptidase domain
MGTRTLGILDARGMLTVVGLALLFMVMSADAAPSMTLEQASVIAAKSTFYLDVMYQSCDETKSDHELATAFLVTSDGLAVTSAHLFHGKNNCSHKIISIIGQHAKATAATAKSEKTFYLRLMQPLDIPNDLAVLEIIGATPSTMLPQTICGDSTPSKGQLLFGFGYEHGANLTPAELHFTEDDPARTKQDVSGLLAEGTSGGPVLDLYGRAIGVVAGGLITENGQDFSRRYIAPISPLLTGPFRKRLRQQCGNVFVKHIPTVDDDPNVTAKDNKMCGFGVPAGFQGGWDRKRDVFRLVPDPTGTRNVGSAFALIDAGFEVKIRRIAIDQVGVVNNNFIADRNILPCEAAVHWYSLSGPDAEASIAAADNDLKAHLLVAGRLSAISDLRNLTSERCMEESIWPTAFIGSRSELAPLRLKFPNATQKSARMWISNNGPGNAAVLFELALQRAESSTVERAISGGKLASDISEDSPSAMRYIVETVDPTQVQGMNAICRAFTNLSAGDFSEVCHAVIGRALAMNGLEGGACLAPVKTEPSNASLLE